MIDDNKYIVLKLETVRELQEYFIRNPHFQEALNSLNKAKVDDAVVIRLQDKFAESGLAAYAMNIQSVLDIVQPEAIGTGAYRSMEETRDWFMQNAHEAGVIRRDGQAKLPD